MLYLLGKGAHPLVVAAGNVEALKLYFSSGIASAASTTSFSTMVISRSMAEAIVAGVCGDCCAEGEAVVSCAKTAVVKVTPARSRTIWNVFI